MLFGIDPEFAEDRLAKNWVVKQTRHPDVEVRHIQGKYRPVCKKCNRALIDRGGGILSCCTVYRHQEIYPLPETV